VRIAHFSRSSDRSRKAEWWSRTTADGSTPPSVINPQTEMMSIFGGEIHIQFLDDTYYPFKVNPHFKSWVPVVDNPHCFIVYTPGKTPMLVYYQPVDYWYKPASAPSGYWVDQFDVRVIGTSEAAKEHFPKSGRIAFVGESNELHSGEANPEALLNALQ